MLASSGMSKLVFMVCRTYQRPYPKNYDYVAYPQGFKIFEFVKFTGDNSRTTLEHIGQFLYNVVKLVLVIFTN